jgi:hypothetical protein
MAQLWGENVTQQNISDALRKLVVHHGGFDK